MKEDKRTASVDIPVSVPGDLREAASTFRKALERIGSLYDTQLSGHLSGGITRAREKEVWGEIIEVLKGCSAGLPGHARAGFDDDVRVLEVGIYDLYPVSAGVVGLILGKVFLSSGGGESYYSGAAGVLNRDYEQLIEGYDGHMSLFSERLSSLTDSQIITPPDVLPELRCLDVFSLAGGLNVPHKLICVFYSGGARENVSSLSNITVFINLYVSRFKALTEKIAVRYISGAEDSILGLAPEDTAALLLLWLRGHDVGHFLGTDKLGSVMSEFDMDYMILHELKSDLISLYNLRYLDRALFSGCSLEQAYMVSLSEMLRYIRRGGCYVHPDTGSAYLTYMILKDKGALLYDEKTGIINFDFKLFEEVVEECTVTLLDLFLKGDAERVRAFVSGWGELADVDKQGIPRTCPKELRGIVADTELPVNMDYKFKRVL